jgi:hypothetical protein
VGVVTEPTRWQEPAGLGLSTLVYYYGFTLDFFIRGVNDAFGPNVHSGIVPSKEARDYIKRQDCVWL